VQSYRTLGRHAVKQDIMTPDHASLQSVFTELSWEPSVDVAHVVVAAKDGVVTLSAHFENYLRSATRKSRQRRCGG
jgi:hypothetical protein